jgi:hypothetical protein
MTVAPALTRVLSALLLVSAGAAHALEPAPLGSARCAQAFDGRRADAGICQDFAAAPRLPSSDPWARSALALWAKVMDPVESLTERQTGIVLLSPEARQRDGRPFPPAAWICPGAPPVLYVPHELLAAVYGPTGLGEGLLAFVLGHELGHRLDDFTIDGCAAAFSGASDRQGELERERRADFRAAFYAARAGLDPRRLLSRDVVARFLESEFQVRKSDLDARRAALEDAVGWLDAFEATYRGALALSLGGEKGSASRLLASLDERLAARGVPLPELAFAQALALMSDAAAAAPWLDLLDRLPAPLEPLACRAVHPAHAAYAEDPRDGRVRADPVRRDAARKLLERARRLLDRAEDQGLSPLAVASARACTALALGDPATAIGASNKADERARSATPAIKTTLAANRALMRFAAFLAEQPAPAADASAALKASWRAALGARRADWVAHPQVDRYVASLLGEPATPLASEAPRCGLATTPPPEAALASLASDPTWSAASPAGTCPGGWERRASLGPELTVCRREAGPEATLVKVGLPGLAEPAWPAVDASIVLVGPPAGALRNLESWACGCDRLTARGTSDLGETAWLAACPRLGVPLALVFADGRGRVRRAALLPLR